MHEQQRTAHCCIEQRTAHCCIEQDGAMPHDALWDSAVQHSDSRVSRGPMLGFQRSVSFFCWRSCFYMLHWTAVVAALQQLCSWYVKVAVCKSIVVTHVFVLTLALSQSHGRGHSMSHVYYCGLFCLNHPSTLQLTIRIDGALPCSPVWSTDH